MLEAVEKRGGDPLVGGQEVPRDEVVRVADEPEVRGREASKSSITWAVVLSTLFTEPSSARIVPARSATASSRSTASRKATTPRGEVFG